MTNIYMKQGIYYHFTKSLHILPRKLYFSPTNCIQFFNGLTWSIIPTNGKKFFLNNNFHEKISVTAHLKFFFFLAKKLFMYSLFIHIKKKHFITFIF